MSKELQTKPQGKVATIRDLLQRSKSQIAAALPRHMTADRLMRVAMTAIQRNPKLLDCDQTSLIGAIIQSAQLGLEVDGILGHAYLIPFKGKVQFMPGYKGLIDLARRSGQCISISAHVVYENDSFDFCYGIEERLSHRPALTGRGKAVCVYAIAKLKDGAYAFEVMGIEEVNAIRDGSENYKGAKRNGYTSTWDTNYDEMVRKTAIRRLAKFLPLSPEFQRASALDEMVDAGIPTAAVIDEAMDDGAIEVKAVDTSDINAALKASSDGSVDCPKCKTIHKAPAPAACSVCKTSLEVKE